MKKNSYYLVLLIAFLLPSYLVRFSIFGVPTTLLEILIYISALFTLIAYGLKLKDFKVQYIIPIILLVIGGIIGILVSPDKNIALGQFKALVFDPLVFLWILSKNITNVKQINSVLFAFMLSGIYVSAHALWQYSTGQIAQDDRIVGIFGYSPNYLAFYMVPITLIAGYLFTLNKSKNLFVNILKYTLIIIFILIILLTGSRGAMIALVGSIALGYFVKYLFTVKQAKSTKIALSCIVALLVILGGYMFVKPDFSLSKDEGGRITSSNNIRWEIWTTTVNDIVLTKNNWFTGIGLGNYQNYFSAITKDRINYPEWITPKALTAHNLLLSTWTNFGILGLVALIWILVLFLKKTDFRNPLSCMVFIVMLAILIQGLVDTPIWKNDLIILFWIVIYIGIAPIVENIKS